MASIEQNTALPIYNADGTRFHNLELKKVVADSVVMSLSDKITGEVCYKDNTLGFTMQEYVKYRRNEDEDYTKYFLVNPPTLVREGMVSDNSDLKGMTRYSFEFYHPMYMLGNFPFTDVAVSSDEKKYLSESKEFSWIGKPADYVAKLNKNLEGTECVVVLSSRFPEGMANQLSEVLKFDKNTIADALKTGYDTWGVPFCIDNLREGEYYNANHIDYYSASGGSKRYVVVFGLPSNEILVEEDNNQVPFVFQFGKGVGLKNNSRNPRNNKIITRIAGYGSEKNVPFGYPQIQWYGDSRWEFTEYEGSTINYDSEGKVTNTPKAGAYPLYKGIVGGAYVTLIHHPFTRSHLMPSIYSQSVFNKVSPYLANGNANPDYNPNLQLIDYYDAITDSEFTYINEINSGAPSYEIHEFDVKPELRDGEDKTITSVVPLNDDLTEADSWNDNMEEDGKFEQRCFKVTLPALGFDIYACASITEEMQINMRSGACIGCTFPVQVDWEDYKQNFYNEDGEFDPVIGEGHPRNATKYPDSTSSAISLILQKENSTFGKLKPNIYQHPASGDAFVILGVSLPLSYITNAELRLDMEMKSFMLKNNVHYFDYPLKFDEHFLTTHEDILKQITTNTVVRFQFEGEEEPLELFVKQLTVKYGEGVLPKYDITLTDNIEVVLNQIGRVADSVEKLGALVAILRQTYNRNIWSELDKKLSKVKDDYTPYKLRMGEMQVDGEAHIGGDTEIIGNAEIKGDADVAGDVTTNENYQEMTDNTDGIGARMTSDGRIFAWGMQQGDPENPFLGSHFRTVVFGRYVPGLITGTQSGAAIFDSGHAKFKSVAIGEFIEVPELRFNRATVSIGIGLRSKGGGIIEKVEIDQDGNGGWCRLKLEDGEYGAIEYNDFLLGFYHHEVLDANGDVDVNATIQSNSQANYDNHDGDYELCGFQSVYFRIDQIDAHQFDDEDEPVAATRNDRFHYVLRGNGGTSGRSYRNHPHESMHFALIANPSNTARQSLVVTTTEYEVRLMNLTNWNYTSNNIRSIDGKLDGFSMTSRYWDDATQQYVEYTKVFTGNGTVLGNAYIYGQLDQFERVGYRCYVEQSLNGSILPQDTETETVRVFNGYGEDVTHEFTRFSVTRDSGDAVSDAVWNAAHSNVSNPFQIAFSDLGIDGIYRTSVLFQVTATNVVSGTTTQGTTLDFSI